MVGSSGDRIRFVCPKSKFVSFLYYYILKYSYISYLDLAIATCTGHPCIVCQVNGHIHKRCVALEGMHELSCADSMDLDGMIITTT